MTRSEAELDREARELLAQADAGYAPSRADRDRVQARVQQALAGVPLSVPDAGHEKLEQVADAVRDGAAGWGFGLGAKAVVSALAIGSACFGAGFFAGRQTAPMIVPAPRPAPALAPAPAPAQVPSPLLLEPENEPPGESASVGHRARKPAAPPAPAAPEKLSPTPPDSEDDAEPLEVHTSPLWQETQLLQRAQRALGSGNAQLSRALLDELSEQFPNGALIEERTVARILTECALGKVAEARALAQKFEASYPTSVHAERVSGSCAGNASGREIER